ncbi:hypothetical protein P7K49_038437, partial [Saguinus oedipus]
MEGQSQYRQVFQHGINTLAGIRSLNPILESVLPSAKYSGLVTWGLGSAQDCTGYKLQSPGIEP